MGADVRGGAVIRRDVPGIGDQTREARDDHRGEAAAAIVARDIDADLADASGIVPRAGDGSDAVAIHDGERVLKAFFLRRFEFSEGVVEFARWPNIGSPGGIHSFGSEAAGDWAGNRFLGGNEAEIGDAPADGLAAASPFFG